MRSKLLAGIIITLILTFLTGSGTFAEVKPATDDSKTERRNPARRELSDKQLEMLLKKRAEELIELHSPKEREKSKRGIDLWHLLSYRIRELEFKDNRAAYLLFLKEKKAFKYIPVLFYSSALEPEVSDILIIENKARVRIKLNRREKPRKRFPSKDEEDVIFTFWIFEDNNWCYDHFAKYNYTTDQWDILWDNLPEIETKKFGVIHVTCESGARIYLDDELKGITNDTDNGLIIRDVELGIYEIKAVKNNLMVRKKVSLQKAGINNEKKVHLDFKFAKKVEDGALEKIVTGELKVICEPGADVYINGKLMGKTTESDNGLNITDLEPGLYEVKVVKEGYAPVLKKIRIREGKNGSKEELTIRFKDSSRIKNIQDDTEITNDAKSSPETIKNVPRRRPAHGGTISNQSTRRTGTGTTAQPASESSEPDEEKTRRVIRRRKSIKDNSADQEETTAETDDESEDESSADEEDTSNIRRRRRGSRELNIRN